MWLITQNFTKIVKCKATYSLKNKMHHLPNIHSRFLMTNILLLFSGVLLECITPVERHRLLRKGRREGHRRRVRLEGKEGFVSRPLTTKDKAGGQLVALGSCSRSEGQRPTAISRFLLVGLFLPV